MKIGDTDFYQIRLYKKGSIEIFENVFHHRLHVSEGSAMAIEIKYSSLRNTGLSTNSVRQMDGVYDVQVIDDPDFLHSLDSLMADKKDKEIITNGTFNG